MEGVLDSDISMKMGYLMWDKTSLKDILTTRNAINDIQTQRRLVVSPVVNQIDVFERDWTMEVPLALNVGFNRGVEERRPADGLGEDAKVDEATLLIVFSDHLIVDGLGSGYAVEEYTG